MQPLKIKLLEGKYLWITWVDKSESKISLKKLREMCPCATCLSEREKQSKTYIPILLGSQLTVSNIEMVGSYAIQIKWEDGHSTGIYEFPFLQNLAIGSLQS
ncbi:MAG: DUF971 domain-containing protein [Ignavibacteriaceae bacterium]